MSDQHSDPIRSHREEKLVGDPAPDGTAADATLFNPTRSEPEVVNSKGGKFEVVGRSGTQGQGPFIYLLLQGQGTQIEKAWFETHGCPSSIRCGDWLCKWVVGRPLDLVTVITADDLQLVVGGLPLGKEFCATMAVNALQDALRQAVNEPT